MRLPQQRKTKRQVSRVDSVSSPVGGWNARDPLSSMPQDDAVILDNFFCTPYNVKVRDGTSVWASGISGDVNTITSYIPSGVSSKLFAYASTFVYDVTSSGAVGSPAISGVTNSKWQHENFGTSGGNFLIAVNGSDLPLIYNGTGWNNSQPAAFNTTVSSLTSVGTTATVTMSANHNLLTGMSIVIAGFTPSGYNGTYVITVTGLNTFTYTLASTQGVVTVIGTATPLTNTAITGVNPANFINVMGFKSRLWFVEKDSSKVWYLPTLSIGGAAQAVDLSSIFTNGGYLMAMGTWSLDAGYGMDDYAVFISSRGQVATFKGTDPASSSTWSLIGVYEVGSPIGRRCLKKYAGDLTLISNDGLSVLSKALMSSRVNSKTMLTNKIQSVISDYTTLYSSNFGWEVALYPKENMLLMNIPIGGNQAYQVAMNTITGAWSRFLNINALCFELHSDDNIYYGTSNAVMKFWNTQADSGNNINFEAQQSFNYFGKNAQLKKVELVRPIISTDGYSSLLIGINVDFDLSPPTGIPSFSPVSNAIWDVSVWDGNDTWKGDPSIRKDWQTSFGIGYCISAHMKGALRNSGLSWASTDYVVHDGGVIG